jgi:hypothetical protein
MRARTRGESGRGHDLPSPGPGFVCPVRWRKGLRGWSLLVAAWMALGGLPAGQGLAGPGFVGPSPLVGQIIALPPAEAVLDEGFTSLVALRELSDGSTLVTDSRGYRRVAWVDWESGVVTTVGRRGDGPEEYSTPHALYALAGDTTLLTDSQVSRAFLLEGNRIVGTFTAAQGDLFRSIRSRPYGADAEGRVVTADGFLWDRTLPDAQSMAPDSMYVLVAGPVATAGGASAAIGVDTIARIRGRGHQGYCMGGGAPGDIRWVGGCSPVFLEDHPLMFRDGWLALARHEPFRVDWRSPDGRWIRGAPLATATVGLTDTEKCAALHGWPFRGLSEACDRTALDVLRARDGRNMRRDWPERLPAFIPAVLNPGMQVSAPSVASLLEAPGGRLIVRRIPSAGSMGEGTQYDLVDRSGARVGVVNLPANEAILGFGLRHVYIVETDSLGEQRIRRHAWPSSP